MGKQITSFTLSRNTYLYFVRTYTIATNREFQKVITGIFASKFEAQFAIPNFYRRDFQRCIFNDARLLAAEIGSDYSLRVTKA